MPEKIFSLTDLTSLYETDTADTIKVLCQKALTPTHHVAAVCVYPQFIKTALSCLPLTIPVATVANFPAGTDVLSAALSSIQQSIADGAREVDIVFPYQNYLAGNHEEALQFIRACKSFCGKNIILKVILETGALKDARIIAEVSQSVIVAGADFLKTSTGKIAIGATVEAATIMLQAIRQSGQSVGLKVSGGIRTVEQARQYIHLAENIMGKDWISPRFFRIGVSQLLG